MDISVCLCLHVFIYLILSLGTDTACVPTRSLHKELGQEQQELTLIKGDNDGSIAMARNPQFHKRSNHINTHWHWVQDQVEQKTLKIESCHDPQQTADVLTKALPRLKHQKHVTEMRPWDWQWHKGECRNTCIITMICDHVCDVTSNRCTDVTDAQFLVCIGTNS